MSDNNQPQDEANMDAAPAEPAEPRMVKPFPCYECRYMREMRMPPPTDCPDCADADANSVVRHFQTTPKQHLDR